MFRFYSSNKLTLGLILLQKLSSFKNNKNVPATKNSLSFSICHQTSTHISEENDILICHYYMNLASYLPCLQIFFSINLDIVVTKMILFVL